MFTSKIWTAPMVGVMLFGSAVAQADSISSAIEQQFGTGANHLAFDDDVQVGTASDGGDGRLDVGDRLRGHLIFRNITNAVNSSSVTLGGVDVRPPTDVNELTGFIEIEVISKTGTATTGFTYQFGAWTSGGTITAQSGNANAVLALYEDSAQNGVLSGIPIPDPTLVDGQLWGFMGLNGPGSTTFTVRTEEFADGIHHDESSAALVPVSELLGSGNVRLNLIDQGGAALTDQSKGVYTFGPNAFGTQFAGSFDFFGGAGTGADYTAALEIRSNVQIIPLPPSVLAAIPGLAMLGYGAYRRRRLA
jgi:hypothetical protein